jgi:hypothetical protein
MIRALVAAAVLALSATALVACGGDDDEAADDRRIECVEEAQNVALARVAREAYEDGKLGGAEQVREDVRGLEGLGDSPAPFLRDDGTMIEWQEMSDAQRTTFLTWVDTPRVNGVLGETDNEAVDAAARDASASCEATST